MSNKIRFFQSIQFKIALVFMLLILATVEIIGAYFVRHLEQENVTDFRNQVDSQIADYTINQIGEELLQTNTIEANKKIKSMISDTTLSEVQVIDSNGTIRADSNVNDQSIIGTKTTDAQVKKVLYSGLKNSSEIYDQQTGSYYIHIVPIKNPKVNGNANNNVIGALYVRASMTGVYKNIHDITRIFLYSSLMAALIGMVIAIVISRAITRPIDEMKKQAIRMARGDYSGQVHVYGQDELGQLAVAVNNLSVRVEEAQEASEAERRRLDSVLTHMTDGVIATDRRGNVTIINNAALEFLDLRSEEAIGKSILKVLNLEHEYTFRDLLKYQHEMILDLSQDEHDLILHVDFSLIQRDIGFISGLVCVLHDVTEQQKNDRERREFVSNVSHELRTPLTSMRSYIDALVDGAWKDPKIAPQFLKVTQDETDRMIHMINDLLSLSRLDRGVIKMDLETVNLNEFLNYILDRFDMMIKTNNQNAAQDNNSVHNNLIEQVKNKHYVIKRKFTKRDLWVEIDTNRFMQIIDNIVNNAIKYSPNGGVITCSLFETNNQVMISIADQGLGIPRKYLRKVFDRFYRVDKARSRQQGGTGLGLAISKEMVEAMGGKIWVESQGEGKGSTFYIALPYEPIDEGDWED